MSFVGRAAVEFCVLEEYVDEFAQLMRSYGFTVDPDFDPRRPGNVRATDEEVERARSQCKARFDREIGRTRSDAVRRIYTSLRDAWFAAATPDATATATMAAESTGNTNTDATMEEDRTPADDGVLPNLQ